MRAPLGIARALPLRVMLLLVAFIATGCAQVPPHEARVQDARDQAASKGWVQSVLPAGPFRLTAFHAREIRPNEMLTIYIEGDGLAWISASKPSSDPTPIRPMALQLALAHPAGNAAYLARPCQYSTASRTDCAQRYWTNARFAPEVIAAMNAGVDHLKKVHRAREVSLVGYSGGGAVAALLAAQRDDVAKLVTVAGNLDHDAWTRYHRLSPLTGSLNASNRAVQIAHIPQTHFVGARDQVIPQSLARAWPAAFLGADGRNLQVIPGFDHVCCWESKWPELLATY